MQTESQLELPTVSVSSGKPVARCPKCGSSRTVRKASSKKFKAFECFSCGYAWKEEKIPRIPSRVRCVLWMVVTVFAYVVGVELARELAVGLNPVEIGFLPVLFVFSMSHVSLHALASRFFGYRAFPIPILFPPILGICIGPKPQRVLERFVIGLAPVLLTVADFLVSQATGDDGLLMLGIVNLFCTAFDTLPLVLPTRRRRPNLIFNSD